MISLIYIIIVTLISILAYVISPDKSINANMMDLSLHSRPPLFKVKVINVPNNLNSEKFSQWLVGKQKVDDQISIEKIIWIEDELYYQPFGSKKDFFKKVPISKFDNNLTNSQIEKKYIKTKTFWLGTDKYGRDLLSRIIIGSRISLSIGIIAVLISLILGVFLGLLAGYYGGLLDTFIMWLINVVWSIPSLLMVIGISLALGKGFWQVFIAVGLTMWVEVARLVRGQVISIREKTYIEAAKGLGFSNRRILLFHILPMIVPSLIVICSANFASAILIESGLSFLGIGAQPPVPSWGGMIKDHFRYILLGKPYLAIVPGLSIMSLVFAFMTLGNSLRDTLDVKN